MVQEEHHERAGRPPVSRHELSYALLVQGRERVRDVLTPHLGEHAALERANNIAQALAFDDLEPTRIAFDMLRQVPESERAQLACQVTRAWLSRSG
jgi:hypothetical protein